MKKKVICIYKSLFSFSFCSSSSQQWLYKNSDFS